MSLCRILLVGLNNPVIASPQFKNQDASIEVQDLQGKSQLDQSLEIINEMDDSQLKVILLNNLALSYAKSGNLDQAIAILDQSFSITNILTLYPSIKNMNLFLEQRLKMVRRLPKFFLVLSFEVCLC